MRNGSFFGCFKKKYVKVELVVIAVLFVFIV